ncbi:5155_t:CDS:2 [Acaulospora morrowiae]|uniref:5155_t:CDS:1 n=1 Tax=Acaulospora morrowiae TaxID=94023 RepID=A0A9N9AZZ3_9GLOM|nr:5155_t:CDS:2 [Acaulospora morrowiae]
MQFILFAAICEEKWKVYKGNKENQKQDHHIKQEHIKQERQREHIKQGRRQERQREHIKQEHRQEHRQERRQERRRERQRSFVALPASPSGVTRRCTFELKKVNLDIDGFTRTVWSVNGQYPGPIIRANIGDTFEINVINHLGDFSGVHWHGLEQRGTNWYDGASGITQCPIKDGKNLTYSFKLTQSGTFWYHSHYLAQYVDGLKGPIVIHDPNDPNKGLYDLEYVMEISDWYRTPTTDPGMVQLFMSDGYTGGDPVPDSGEISGVGQYNCTIPDCTPKKFATYKVTKGKRYRFRIINTSAMLHFIVMIDNHPLQVIEVEGTAIKPYTTNYIPVNIAQRYSVIVNANQPVGNYFIRAIISDCSLGGGPGTINGDSPIYDNLGITGILRYEGASGSVPTTKPFTLSGPPDCLDISSANLKPLKLDKQVPTDKNVQRVTLTIGINVRPRLQATINNSSFEVDFNHPSNERVQDGTPFVTSDNAYTINKSNAPVEIVLVNTERRTHPFHLHGHSFWVVAQGGVGSFNQSISSLKYNFDNPPFRDTLTIDALSMTAIRFYADNPGVWLIHCHIEWHVEMGMVAQLIEVPDEFKKLTIPDGVKQLCK